MSVYAYVLVMRSIYWPNFDYRDDALQDAAEDIYVYKETARI